MRHRAKRESERRRDKVFPSRWLRRLDLVKAEFQSARWPESAEEGIRQVLALSGYGWSQLMGTLKAEDPDASAHQLEEAAHRILRRWDASRQALLSIRNARKEQHGHGME